MSILSQLLSDFFNSSNLFSNICNKADSFTYPFVLKNQYFDTAMLIHEIGKFSYSLAQFTFKAILEKADTEFRNLPGRTKRWYVKNTRCRTITTPFGDVIYKRTIYSSCLDEKKLFCYVDEKFGIPKYDRYDPCVKAMAIDLYSKHNSMIKVGQIIGQYISSPFSLDKNRSINALPRQTVFAFLKSRPRIREPLSPRKATPSHLYIMADEKWIALQSHNEDGTKQRNMTRAAVVFEDVEDDPSQKKRHRLVNRFVFFENEEDFWPSLHSRLGELYDMDKIEKIWIMGDGASWIKNGQYEFRSPSTDTDFSLDKFHFGQSLNRITQDENIRDQLFEYIIEDNDKNSFKLAVEAIIEASPERKDIIEQNLKYILNNWNAIQNSRKECFMPCSMESAISHHICSMFTSVPKAYIKENLTRYLDIRMNTLNGIDNVSQYIRSVGHSENEKGFVEIKKEYDLSIFDGPKETYAFNLPADSWMKNTLY